MPDHTHEFSAIKARKLLPLILALVRPRAWTLAGSVLLMFVSRMAALAVPGSLRFLIDRVIQRGRLDLLPEYAAIVIVALAVQNGCAFLTERAFAVQSQVIVNDLRCRLYEHISRLPVAFFDKKRVGAITSRILTDLEGVRNLVGPGVVNSAGVLFTAVVALASLAWMSVPASILALASVTLIVLQTRARLSRTKPLLRERSSMTAQLSARLTESLSGIRIVKAYGAESSETRVFAENLSRIVTQGRRMAKITATANLVLSGLSGLMFLALMCFCSIQIVHGHLSVGELVTIMVFYGMLVGPASQLVGTGAQLMEALVAFERAQEILDEPVEDASGKRTAVLGQLEGSILFENMIFAYGDGPPVLQGLSFSAAPGSITALVGASGAGKSTIMHLIAAFYRCNSGRILVDGVNLDEATLSSYRRQVGIVSQQTFLFHGSVRENIAFARPAATLSEIREVCRLANVDEFVRHLPEGLETEIGERGVRLSGGQCQRIAIARALLANPRILVLDEATSNLDSESEAVVQDGLARLMAGRTTFVCAHRLSTVRTADQILVIENGRIVERGCHDSLYAKRGRYWELQGDHLPAADAANAG